jgi:predicted amino acid racemase
MGARRTPRIEIDLETLSHNAKCLRNLLTARKIEPMGVVKGVLGHPDVSRVFVEAGISKLGDSRIENLVRLRSLGLPAVLCCLTPPARFELPELVRSVDESYHCEPTTLEEMAKLCSSTQRSHRVVLLVNAGGARDGIGPDEVVSVAKAITRSTWLRLSGIATHFGCPDAKPPTSGQLDEFLKVKLLIELALRRSLPVVSVGGSVSIPGACDRTSSERTITEIRVGEVLFLGTDWPDQLELEYLCKPAIRLFAEIVALPATRQSFSKKVGVLNIGTRDLGERATLNRCQAGLLHGASGDLTLIDFNNPDSTVGEEILIDLSYDGLVNAMLSPYVEKLFVQAPAA